MCCFISLFLPFLQVVFLFYRRVSQPVGTRTWVPLVSNGRTLWVPRRPASWLVWSPARWQTCCSCYGPGMFRGWQRDRGHKAHCLPAASWDPVKPQTWESTSKCNQDPKCGSCTASISVLMSWFVLSHLFTQNRIKQTISCHKTVPLSSSVLRPQECVQLIGTHWASTSTFLSASRSSANAVDRSALTMTLSKRWLYWLSIDWAVLSISSKSSSCVAEQDRLRGADM